ncbi:arabinofuranosyltransferase [Nocardia mangyaensis]|uniref:arabinofuranosyltransferase n=1 Tax=Nocardia mangyaensis TaxID=2213200 RepID=UPI002674B896|nr:arabinofuranosyltransferase [Nocardia mangyaensis]MDO3647620.1 arabinofuranosyltransferase [Nocardia mangyaensis]
MTTNEQVRPGRRIGAGVAEAAVGALVALVVTVVGLYAFSAVQWPAFNSSHVTRALTTVGQFVAVVLLVVAVALIRLRKWPVVAKLASWVGISSFVTVTLGMPLAATKLYLFGISVDQEFRTQYLTRLTDSAALRDMNYVDMPPFYPAGWFWLGGRVANVLGMDGWEAFKPYSIGLLAVAAVVALVLWTQVVRADLAVGAAAAVTAMTLAYASPEAYGAVLVLFIPPVLILAWGALYRPSGRGGWGAVLGTGLFLGVAACFYTLYLAIAAFTVVLMAVLSAGLAVHARRTADRRAWRSARARKTAPPGESGDNATAAASADAPNGQSELTGASASAGTSSAIAAGTPSAATGAPSGPAGAVAGAAEAPRPDSAPWRAAIAPLTRLVAIGAISGLLALVVWTPYLVEMLSGAEIPSGSAFHYLPESGAQLAFPMLEFSLRGGLCLIGVLWLVVRAGSSRRAQALGIGVVAIYLWTLLSMTATAAGTTLLSFRLEPVLLALLAAAGVFGFVEGGRAVYQALNEPAPLRTTAAVVAVLGALAFAQSIPTVLTHEIDTAYTDTVPTEVPDADGTYGERADKRKPSAVAYYHEVDEAILAHTGRPRSESVVLTADTSFLAYYPYFGFQALTSHYANPLADFKGRADTIAAWSELDSSPALLDALSAAPWRAPDAFLFRRDGDNYTLRLAEDVYPNDPNVKRYTVTFPAALFTDPAFAITDIGPFTLITVRR